MEKKKKHCNWSLYFIFVMITVMMAMGIVIFHFYMNSFQEVFDEKEYSRYYVMIAEDRKSSFWQSVYQGAYERGLQEGVYVDLLGDNLSQDYSKEELMKIAISCGVDGIIVSGDESDEMTALIDEAEKDGIPVVTLYDDNTKSSRCSFVGVGSYNLGREYGRQILKIQEKRQLYIKLTQKEDKYYVTTDDSTVKVVVLVNAYAQNSGQNILCSGIQDAVEQEKKRDINLELSLVSVDDTNEFSVEESIRDIFMEKELPDIIICLNELNTTCIYQAVVDYNKVGQVNILGYYDSDTILKAIARNVIYATISVDEAQMGSYCIDALTEYYEMGNTSQYFTADITLINKENVSQYLKGDDDENKE